MLKKIPTCLSPELVKAMMEMGHGDRILIADGNYPAKSNNPNVVRADGHQIIPLLEAILELLPLDADVDHPVTLMDNNSEVEPPVWNEYRRVVKEVGEDEREFKKVERFDFYDLASSAALVLQTGDLTLYGNIMLQKGTISK